MSVFLIILIDLAIVVICVLPTFREDARERGRAKQRKLAFNRQCINCGYSLQGLPETTTACPECGEAIRSAK